MLKFNELIPMREYYRFTSDTEKIFTKVRVNNFGVYQAFALGNGGGEWFDSTMSHNSLVRSMFEECEFEPKLGDEYFYPDYEVHAITGGRLAYKSLWCNKQYDLNVKRNVGIYRTPEEAHAKALTYGWTV